MLSLRFTEHGKTSLRELDIAVQQKVTRVLKAFAKQPDKGQLLREDLTGFRSLHIGQYRVIYQQTATHIIVFLVGYRSTVYDRMIESLRRSAEA